MVSEEQVVNAAYQWLVSINQFHFDKKDINFNAAFAFLQRLGLLSLHMHDKNPEHSRFRVLPPNDASNCLLQCVQEIAAE